MTDMVPMYGFGGGGTGGGRIRVYVDPGSQVTLTQTYGGKTKTAVADSSGQALFKGLGGGQWEAVATLNGQTAKGSTIVSLDYDLHLTYFTATINITYPAGLTCKATNGSTTLTAPDTSGTWACVVPNAGTWMVSLSSGFAEKVTVAVTGESHTVNKWYVYKDGDQYTDLTGGWVKQSETASITFGDNMITIDSKTSTNQPKGRVHTTNSLNLSGFTSLKANITIKQYNATVSSASAGVHNSSGKDLASTSTKSNAIVSVDISSIESLSEIHPFFYENAAKANLLQMWLEV